MVSSIQIWLIVTISDNPIGPLSFCVWCLPLKIKLLEERQREIRSQISSGDSLVRDLSEGSFFRRFLMRSMAWDMGTDGKSAVASYETILSYYLEHKYII